MDGRLKTVFGEVRSAAERVAAEIANGPIVPSVTPEEIRGYLASRYDFTEPWALDDVIVDVEQSCWGNGRCR